MPLEQQQDNIRPYEIHISQFDGPLDLLLHLIEKAELDIKDIFISEITTQYLSYMEEINGLDMDTASEFLNMAATLLYIKSRQLLSRPPQDDELSEEDPEELLIRQLREYQTFKKAGEELEALQALAKGAFVRLPEEIILPEQEINLSDATMQELFHAFFALLHAQHEEPQVHPLHQVKRDYFTVRGQIVKIRETLALKHETKFEELFTARTEKLEIIVTFMALMEMISRGEIILKQNKPYAPIYLYITNSLGKDDSDFEYMDEYAE